MCSTCDMIREERAENADLERQLAEAQAALEAERMTRHPADDTCTTTLMRERDEAAAREVGYRDLLERLGEVFGCCAICGDAPHNCELDLKDQLLQRQLRATLAPAQGKE